MSDPNRVLVESNSENIACPLCQADKARLFSRDKRRTYYACTVCSLIFVPPVHFLSVDAEKKRYDLHQNSPHDLSYCGFLERLFIPLQRHLAPKSQGLDFGSGPSPTLSIMFEQAGHSMTLYDVFYEPVPAALEQQYDFITATEVVEHLREPRKDLERLWSCVKPGGRLGIMTQCAVQQDVFSEWHYKNDLTHVCFFSRITFGWLAIQWDAGMAFPDNDIVLFLKKNSQ